MQYKVIRILFTGIIGINLFFAANVNAEEIDPGQLLYENHCSACHTSVVHERKNLKAKSIIDLTKFVIRWQHHLKLDWTYDEVRLVASYLNGRYYHFDKQP
ncbi:MAG: cytochrome c [Gammaproteobacteria bacterium]|nr:cytochrome c [Gammaproteobacteria bacterium]